MGSSSMMGGGGMMGGMGGMGARDEPMEMMKRMDSLADLAPRSAGDRYARETGEWGELSEKESTIHSVSKPVDRLLTESESMPILGDIPLLGRLHREGIVAADTAGKALSDKTAEPASQPARPAPEISQSLGAYGIPTDGRARGAVPATRTPQQWGRANDKEARRTGLGLTNEALTEEFRAGRRSSASSSRATGAGIVPSTKPAPAPSGPQRVLLDAKVVVVDRDELMNHGIEWSWPTVQAGTFRPDGQVQHAGVGQKQGQLSGDAQIGVSSGEAFTNALNMQINLLEEQGEARVVANPKVMTQEGKAAELGVISEQYSMMGTPDADGDARTLFSRAELEKIESGTKLSITPHIGDNDDINLDLAFELSDGVPQGRGTELPVVTRRKTMDTVAVRDGGTVVLRGPSSGQSADEGGKEVVVLITPRLVPQGVAQSTEPQVEKQLDVSETIDETSAPVDTDPPTHAKAEEDDDSPCRRRRASSQCRSIPGS